MAWFGETFGESLNSLKGQITKITKDVLTENEDSEDVEEIESATQKLVELQALCESKDLEIASLRQENNQLTQQFKKQVEFLKKENRRISPSPSIGVRNFEFTDDHVQYICELENLLTQVKEEKDRLFKSLEELNVEHEKEISEVIKGRDQLKQELKVLKDENTILKSQQNKPHVKVPADVNDFKELQVQSGVSAEEIQLKDHEILALKMELQALQLQLETEHREKEESYKTIKKEIIEHENIKIKLEKLVSEIKILTEDKHKTDAENKKLKAEVETLKRDINNTSDQFKTLKKENEELKVKINLINKENASFQNQLQSLGNRLLFEENTQSKLKQIIEVLDVDDSFSVNECDTMMLGRILDLLQDKFHSLLKKEEQLESHYNQIIENLESDLNSYKGNYSTLVNEIKINSEKWLENEQKYKDNILMMENAFAEMKAQQQDCMIKSQTDDVKRLEQEVTQLANVLQMKENELHEAIKLKSSKEEELQTLKSLFVKIEEEVNHSLKEKDLLQKEIILCKNIIQQKDEEYLLIHKEKQDLEEKVNHLDSNYAEMKKSNSSLAMKLSEITEANRRLSSEVEEVHKNVYADTHLKEEYRNSLETISNFKNLCDELQQSKSKLEHQVENLKAQVIIKETALAETVKSSNLLEAEAKKLKVDLQNLKKLESEASKWKEASVDLELQRQDLIEEKFNLEKECTRLSSELADLQTQLVRSQEDFKNELLLYKKERVDLNERNVTSEMSENINEEHEHLTKENIQLKNDIEVLKNELQKLKWNMLNVPHEVPKENIEVSFQEHRRTKSAVDFNPSKSDASDSYREMEQLKNTIQQEQSKYRQLQNDYTELKEKESNSRRELERLRIHLVEVEDHYTSEAVESEKTIADFKLKLANAEEQLKNSSSIYKSANVRANQHLESLQSQIRLISLQRDDLQAKLSSAEDEVQKHNASLTSLQIVLEQFQQDKEREIEGIVTKYEYQIQLSQRHFKELEFEIESLRKQLSEAKNGLNAASRLGEKLERKTQQIAQLEASLSEAQNELKGMENQLVVVNQSNASKIDKSLIKNLVIGYISSPQADRKSQVLRIMSSVLDFSPEERTKTGVDISQAGWLSSILHPKNDHAHTTQSLSEAFIRFLESESCPQPQLKLLPEQTNMDKSSKPSGSSKSLLFSELVLPTFGTSSINESSTILKDVLKDNS